MEHPNGFSKGLLVLSVLSTIFNSLNAVEFCSNTILPGSKGDMGEGGDQGDQGRLGKTGPPGLLGLTGELGGKGEVGRTGKMGPAGDKGDAGEAGVEGPSGLKGKAGTTCDCGRYRKVVGQMDVNVRKLKNAVKFVKNVILGIKETEDTFYLIVKEARKYREALMNCKLRGGILAMPKTTDTNSLIAEYVTQAGLTRVFIGLQAGQKGGGPVYADLTPVRNYTAWGLEEPSGAPTNTSCVEMISTGTWNQVECDATMYYVCEFKKSRRGLAAVL
ncbi:collectin-10 isoform X1 [Coregonus clupeaformis]|uniref:collectin-10 isoform X1 n=1 Tax=Coregonus clupeaformis TaxID=59861 RepID=UPI001BE123AD|nr:collectin-10 isoform X1 [Coregonus clupeaformis]